MRLPSSSRPLGLATTKKLRRPAVIGCPPSAGPRRTHAASVSRVEPGYSDIGTLALVRASGTGKAWGLIK